MDDYTRGYEQPPPNEESLIDFSQWTILEIQEHEALVERVAKALEGWPWASEDVPKKLTMEGLYSINCHHEGVLVYECNPQTNSKLLDLMDKNDLIRDTIFKEIFKSHKTTSRFVSSCQTTLLMLKSVAAMWDFNKSWYSNCELNVDQHSIDGSYSSEQPSVKSAVIISPLKAPGLHLTYQDQVRSLHKMCIAFKNFSFFFQNIQLHRIPFLTIDLLRLILPELRNLEHLGVYRCQLIHVGDGPFILEYLKNSNDHRNQGLLEENKRSVASFDFYPNFHVGPELSSAFHVGSFGVSWDDLRMNTILAVWKHAMDTIGDASKMGIDMYSPNTSYYKFLKDSPCWDVDRTLMLMLRVLNICPHDESLPMGVPDYRKKSVHSDGFTPIDLTARDAAAVQMPEICRMIVAMDQRNPFHHGNYRRFIRYDSYFNPGGYEWTLEIYLCSGCNQKLLGIFFDFQDTRELKRDTRLNITPPVMIDCLGCKLNKKLDQEKDHLKEDKRDVIGRWIQGDDVKGDYGPRDLAWAIRRYHIKEIDFYATRVDAEAAIFRQLHGYDAETQARQQPVPAQALRGNRGNFLGAPQLGEWEREVYHAETQAVDPEHDRWTAVPRDRYLGHTRLY